MFCPLLNTVAFGPFHGVLLILFVAVVTFEEVKYIFFDVNDVYLYNLHFYNHHLQEMDITPTDTF